MSFKDEGSLVQYQLRGHDVVSKTIQRFLGRVSVAFILFATPSPLQSNALTSVLALSPCTSNTSPLATCRHHSTKNSPSRRGPLSEGGGRRHRYPPACKITHPWTVMHNWAFSPTCLIPWNPIHKCVLQGQGPTMCISHFKIAAVKKLVTMWA